MIDFFFLFENSKYEKYRFKLLLDFAINLLMVCNYNPNPNKAGGHCLKRE